MKITLNIETQDPSDLARIAAALTGTAAVVTQDATPKAAPKAKVEKAPENPTPSTASTQTDTASTQTVTAGASTSQDAAPASVTQKSPSDAAPATVSENDLIAAANQAIANLGADGAMKVKNYISANFKRADGTPGSLKTTAEDQRPALLAALQKIATKEIAV